MKMTLGLVALLSVSMSARAINVEFSGVEFSNEERSVIASIAETTETEVREVLPTLDLNLVLVVKTGTFVIEQTGETGKALSPGTIQWTVDNSRPEGVIAIARAHLRHTLFHEFHHLVRRWLIEGGDPTHRASFVGAAISEGMATAFARDFGGERAPWADYPDDIEAWVEEIRRLPTNGYRYDHWMFRHPDGRQWIGYRAGTYLVDRAMRASGKNAVELSTTPAKDILDMGSTR